MHRRGVLSISHLKKVFSTDIGIEPSYQVLDILEYACRRSRQQTGRVDPRPRVLVPRIFGGRSRPKILILRWLIVYCSSNAFAPKRRPLWLDKSCSAIVIIENIIIQI